MPDSGFDLSAVSERVILGSRNKLTRSSVALTACGRRAKLTDGIRPNNATNNNNNNNNRISIAPYGRNFRGAGGRSDQCSVKA